MSDSAKPKLVGINHVAIEVGDIDEALAWYGRIFEFTLRGKGERNAFIDMGDQFINLTRLPSTRRRATSAAISASSSMTAPRCGARRGGRREDG